MATVRNSNCRHSKVRGNPPAPSRLLELTFPRGAPLVSFSGFGWRRLVRHPRSLL